jgi:hypothetical protein
MSIRTFAASASEDYEFFRRPFGRVLVRRATADGKTDRLVKGRWIPRIRRRHTPGGAWSPIKGRKLRNHVRRYLIADLDGPVLTWRNPLERLRRSISWRWLYPPLKGGAARRSLDSDAIERSRTSYAYLLRDVKGTDLGQLESQALLGLEHQRERASGVEQRANFFLGAAGLTTTLVLTNANFLIGDQKLDEPWLAIAAGILVFASLCAVFSGIRALQAAMLTFSRTPPNTIKRVLQRREVNADGLRRHYVASLLVAQARTTVVGDWKIARLREARRFFLGVILGVVGLSACVLFGGPL